MGYWLGQCFLWAGFISGAFYAARFQEVTEDKWSTVPWFWYGISLAVGTVGVILLQASSKAAVQSSERVETEYSTLTESMARLLDRVGVLRAKLNDMPPSQIVSYIDDELTEPFAEFADSRNALIQRHGLQAFADVMTQFASGERFVNRAWSAAADGYVHESATSLERAEGHLQRASQQMEDLNVAGKKDWL